MIRIRINGKSGIRFHVKSFCIRHAATYSRHIPFMTTSDPENYTSSDFINIKRGARYDFIRLYQHIQHVVSGTILTMFST